MPAPDQNVQLDLDNHEFLQALELINNTSRSVFLTGKAGTGKSTFLRYVTSHTRKKFVVLAPTGIAAVNVDGQTLHSFFRLPFHPVLPDDPDFARQRLKERLKYPSQLVKIIRQVELIIIDEISMVRADTIDLIDRILRLYGEQHHLPFGGKQLLLVGDIFQLEPVVTPDQREIIRRFYPNQFFFSALAFNDLRPVAIELRKVYRQSDPVFIGLLDRVRAGHATADDIALLNSKVAPSSDTSSSSEGDFVMTLAARRNTVDYINESHLDAIARPEFVFEGTIKGDFPDNSLPTDLNLRLKEGAQVVFIKNDIERRWVNGTIGRVTAIAADLLKVKLESGAEYTVEPEKWANLRYVYNEKTKTIETVELGTFEQYPVKLAWALTIHKSQGLTFSRVAIDLGQGAFAGGQTYVALSRCRSLDGLALRATVAPRDVFVNPVVTAFARTFNDPVIFTDAINRAKAERAYLAAIDALSERRFGKAFDAFVEGLRLHSILDDPRLMRLARSHVGALKSVSDEIDALKAQVEADRARFDSLAAEYLAMGRDCLNDDLPVPALANFDKALSLSPRLAGALRGRADALIQMADYNEAVAALRSLLDVSPDDFDSLLSLGEIHIHHLDDVHNALDCAMRLQEIIDAAAPDYSGLTRIRRADFHLLMASILDALDDPARASVHRSKAAFLRRKK